MDTLYKGNSYDEWTRLSEARVGGAHYENRDLDGSFKQLYFENITPALNCERAASVQPGPLPLVCEAGTRRFHYLVHKHVAPRVLQFDEAAWL